MRSTGHALIDVGEAALHSIVRIPADQDLTNHDLEKAADWLAQNYTMPGPLQRLIRSSAFFNAGYYQQSDTIRQGFIDLVLYSWRETEFGDDQCAFCLSPASYRANREHVPLLNGRHVYNFAPDGQAGIPICGRCSLAMQALPLGCKKSGKRLIAAHSDNPLITYHIAQANVREIMYTLSLPDLDKLPGQPFERTRFVELLVGWLAQLERRSISTASLTGYCFTNYGAEPSITIYRLDVAVSHWVEMVMYHAGGAVQAAWQHSIERGWYGGGRDAKPDEQANKLYEDLLLLPDDALHFCRRHVLPQRSWAYAQSYLEGIMQMTPEDIEKIRIIGERFAHYAGQRRGFFYEFSRTDEFASWRRVVLRAADDCARRYDNLLIDYDEFTDLFIPREDEYNNWRLIRDLITLIMIEARVGEDDEPLFDPEDESEDDQ